MQKGNQDYKNLNLENENNFLQDIVHSIQWTFRKKRRKKKGARFWSMAKYTLSKTSGHIFRLDFKFPYVRENKNLHTD